MLRREKNYGSLIAMALISAMSVGQPKTLAEMVEDVVDWIRESTYTVDEVEQYLEKRHERNLQEYTYTVIHGMVRRHELSADGEGDSARYMLTEKARVLWRLDAEHERQERITASNEKARHLRRLEELAGITYAEITGRLVTAGTLTISQLEEEVAGVLEEKFGQAQSPYIFPAYEGYTVAQLVEIAVLQGMANHHIRQGVREGVHFLKLTNKWYKDR